MGVVKKTYIGTIDATPTWLSCLPLMLQVIRDGDHVASAAVEEEFRRMAQAADAGNIARRG